MLHKYRWYEYVLIYFGLAVFLTFVLAPFVEAFVVSMRPLSSLFSIPYRFITDEMSFEAYFTMWQNVPLLWLYMLNSFFIATVVTVLGLFCIIRVSGPKFAARHFHRGEHVFRSSADHPTVQTDAAVRTAEHLFCHDRTWNSLRHSYRHLAAALLSGADTQGA
jgi:ABC-type sugar transport system permease subunit